MSTLQILYALLGSFDNNWEVLSSPRKYHHWWVLAVKQWFSKLKDKSRACAGTMPIIFIRGYPLVKTYTVFGCTISIYQPCSRWQGTARQTTHSAYFTWWLWMIHNYFGDLPSRCKITISLVAASSKARVYVAIFGVTRYHNHSSDAHVIPSLVNSCQVTPRSSSDSLRVVGHFNSCTYLCDIVRGY